MQALLCVKEMVLWSCGRGEGQSFWYYVGCKGFSDCDPVKTGISAIPDLDSEVVTVVPTVGRRPGRFG